jgi:thioredoxin reductase
VKVIVVGGGAAGLTAALVLARARHQVTVIDDQTYRNATVEEFHGFPTRDATAPNHFRADAIRDVRSYGVVIVNSGVTGVEVDPDRHGITIEFADGTPMEADAMLLATGVHDDLPTIDGLAERWGKSVFNCPFCDGWEHRDQPVVVIDAAPGSDHLASMIRSWTSDVTVLEANAVAALTGDGTKLSHVVLRDGSTVAAAAAFVKAPITPRSGLARHLGCDLDPDGYIVTNHAGATSHPLVWAAGDVRRPAPMPHQVVLAAADGSAAAIDMHKAFVAGNIGRVPDLPDQPRPAASR